MLTCAKQPGLTRCGHPFTLRANVEFLDELPRIEQNGACGIGLLRTETVLFETKNFDVEKQIEFYSQVVKAAGKNPVTIDRKSTRLNSSHVAISYAVFCLKKKTEKSKPAQHYPVTDTNSHIHRCN